MTSIIGKSLNYRYKITETLGQGGMAEVYKVYDEQKFTYFAVKVLHENLATDRVFLRRFQREAQTLIQLQHPNIVRLYGLEQDGAQAFMVMDFIDGSSLRRTIFNKKRAFMPHEMINVLAPACAALQFAHSKGYIHCDLKPDNILINSSGQVFLTDFGIARMMDAATSTMIGAGTPAYMAPELVRGQDPTPQTDIYALGVILYEMLTGGERPFTGEHASTSGSTSAKVQWEQVNLTAAPLRKFNKNISPQLEAVVMRCLSKDPRQRFSSPKQLLQAFENATGEKSDHRNDTYVIPDRYPFPQEPAVVQPVYQKNKSLTPYVLGIGGFLMLCFILISALNKNDSNSRTPAEAITRQSLPTSTVQIRPKVAPADQTRIAYNAGIQAISATTLMSESQPALFKYGWYAIDEYTLEENLTKIDFKVYLDDQQIPSNLIVQSAYSEDGYPGREFFLLIDDWPAGKHEIRLESNYLSDLNDGWFDFYEGVYNDTFSISVSNGTIFADPISWPIRYRDDFSMDSLDWFLSGPYDDDRFESSTSFENGKYVIDVIANGEDVFDFSTPLIKLFGNFYVSVDVQRITGDLTNACYGLVLADGYFFEVCDDQYFQFSHLSSTDFLPIQGWTYSDSIFPNQENQLSVEVRDTTINLYLNGDLVSSNTAQYLTDGYFYLLVSTYDANSGTFSFDNVEVRLP